MMKLLFTWAMYLSIALLIFLFLHECGHGFGARLDGKRVSTGFNKVGDLGKKPNDPDFRKNLVIEGSLDSGSLLGPFTNWLFAVVFTALLFTRKSPGTLTFFLGAGAVANAAMRIVPMSGFFISALAGQLTLEDEVCWGLQAARSVEFPMPFFEFRLLARSQPHIFLSEPALYFWPAVSLSISLFCLVVAYRRIFFVYHPQLSPHFLRWIFIFMPFGVWPFLFMLTNHLDNLIRINW